jgi:superfamily I DNA/RNA helicase
LQAVALLEGCEVDDLDDGHDETRRYKSLSKGAIPIVLKEDGIEAALNSAYNTVLEWTKAADEEHPLTTCVIASSRAIRDGAAKLFASKGMKTHVIEVNKKEASEPSTIRFSTMHRAKGLEFDQVLVLVPKAYMRDPSETGNERKLLYVAITRAKRNAGLVVY